MKSTLTVKPVESMRTRGIKRVLWLVFLLNILVAAAKFSYGVISGSVSMQADGIHSVFDSLGNIVGLVGISLASRPADDEHPYGHAKFETYASFIVGVFLLLAAVEVGGGAITALYTQSYGATVGPLSFAVMVMTLAVNITVTLYERYKGKQLSSEILAADAAHTLSDVLVSTGVIIGLAFVALGFSIADPITALVVMLAILYTAFGIFRQALATLSDKSRIPDEQIRKACHRIGGVERVHCIRTRGTQAEVYVDLHVLVDPAMSVGVAHDLCEEVEASIKCEFSQVIEVLVHIEPEDGHKE